MVCLFVLFVCVVMAARLVPIKVEIQWGLPYGFPSWVPACWQPPVAVVDVCEVSLSVTPRWQVVAASGSLQLWPTIKLAFTGFKGIIDGITQGELSSAHTPTPLCFPFQVPLNGHNITSTLDLTVYEETCSNPGPGCIVRKFQGLVTKREKKRSSPLNSFFPAGLGSQDRLGSLEKKRAGAVLQSVFSSDTNRKPLASL